MPVYLIDSMFVSKSNNAFILIIVAINSKLLESIISISACNHHFLRLKDIESPQTRVKVKNKDIIEVDLSIHYPQGGKVEECPIDYSQRLNFGWVLDWN